MAKLEFTLERGGIVTADIFVDKVPQTWRALTAVLPTTLTLLNARWSGRELHNQINLPEKPPRENQTIHASIGDVIYACEWPGVREYTGFEAVAFFYGAETINDWRGSFAANWIGRIDPGQWDLIQEIGERVYRHGGEECQIRAIDD